MGVCEAPRGWSWLSPMLVRRHFCLVPDLLCISVPSSGLGWLLPCYSMLFFLVAAEQWCPPREVVLTRAKWCLDMCGTWCAVGSVFIDWDQGCRASCHEQGSPHNRLVHPKRQ